MSAAQPSEPPFRRVGARELARHWHMGLWLGEYEGPEGDRFERAFLTVPSAVAVVAVDGDEVVLVRQYRTAIEDFLLEIPAGLCDVNGEEVAETARRELAEEAGLAATSLELLGTFRVAAGLMDHHVEIYLGRELTPCATDRHGPEETAMTVHRVKLEDVPAMIAAGELTDAKSVIGLLLARDRLSA